MNMGFGELIELVTHRLYYQKMIVEAKIKKSL